MARVTIGLQARNLTTDLIELGVTNLRKLLSLALLAVPMCGTAKSETIRETAINDPLSVVAALKASQANNAPIDAQMKGASPGVQIRGAAFMAGHISLCDFALSPDAFTHQAEKDKDFMLMVYLTSVANTEGQLERDLKDSGYPESVWREPLSRLTKAQVDMAVQETKQGKSLLKAMVPIPDSFVSMEEALLGALENFRKQSKKKLPKFEVDSTYCGGDFIGMVDVKTSPAGGTVKLIAEYFFQMCLARKLDPYSDDCNLWKTPGSSDFPAGTYRYLAKWQDGPEECGKVDLIHPGSEAANRPVSKTIKRGGQPCRR